MGNKPHSFHFMHEHISAFAGQLGHGSDGSLVVVFCVVGALTVISFLTTRNTIVIAEITVIDFVAVAVPNQTAANVTEVIIITFAVFQRIAAFFANEFAVWNFIIAHPNVLR
jgi:heme/copper-type cytochrome/quinol oxidase subunit 4